MLCGNTYQLCHDKRNFELLFNSWNETTDIYKNKMKQFKVKCYTASKSINVIIGDCKNINVHTIGI